ncbi:MAG: alkaline phosphatase family protein [Lachnospiraceae bacterium]|nr:alkaline phosphatase family protein [Lachnospiraceae bacterium]
MKKRGMVKLGLAFAVAFLFHFMLLIFGPAEIYFANVTEFEFLYGEFAGTLAIGGIVSTLILTLVIFVLPDKLSRVLSSIVFAIAIAGYIQTMFLNDNLDLLGVNPEGYVVNTAKAIPNAVIWCVIGLVVIVLAFVKMEIWKKLVGFCSFFLIAIQAVALVSLMLTAGEEAYERPAENWHISGMNQYTVSAKENVIVIVLDYFSNKYIEQMEAVYPGATDFLHDFTYYSNVDCVYFGTFPSLPHMLTGQEVEMSKTINEWCNDIWNSEETNRFYTELQEKGYIANVYTPDTNILCGTNSVDILSGKIHNVINSSQEVEVMYDTLQKTMVKMSAYRMFPEFIKPYFYANIDEYEDVVQEKSYKMNHNNYDFYQGLLEQGLTKDEESNYYIVQHLMGPHLWTTDEYGYYKEDSTIEETSKGCMVIVEEYLNQLKELGVYDSSTIIITADHGEGYASQVLFYMKQPNETHDVSPVTNAPVSFYEFLPTIADAVGLDAKSYGETIYDYAEGEERERTYWIRWMESDYPIVPCYNGTKDGSSNVYHGYTYTGELEELLKQMEIGPNIIEPMADSYF